MHTKVSLKKRKDREGFLYIVPWLVGVVCFQIGPILISLVLSFTKYSLFAPPTFIGIWNSLDMFRDELSS